VTDAGIDRLRGLLKLTSLNLHHVALTDAGVKKVEAEAGNPTVQISR
jgi:hypothetical protein